MRALLMSLLLVFTGFSAGCLSGDGPQQSDYQTPGCYEGQPDEEPEECVIDNSSNNTNIPANQTEENAQNNTTGNSTVDDQTSEGNSSTEGNNSEVQREVGPWEGNLIFDISADARQLGGEWFSWNLTDQFDLLWNESSSNQSGDNASRWMMIEILSTDCVHCWDAADDMSNLYIDYGGQVDFLSFAVNFSTNDYFNASRSEVAAFQDKTSHSGCRGNQYDCADRPGEPHDWLYIDDRNQSAMMLLESRGTPMFMLIMPNGTVAWHQYQHNGDEGEDDENIIEALARFFPSE